MVCQSCLTVPSAQIGVDTSAKINLVSTRVPEAILDVLPKVQMLEKLTHQIS